MLQHGIFVMAQYLKIFRTPTVQVICEKNQSLFHERIKLRYKAWDLMDGH